jgi:2-polyprenyl-3-methyl-5-hydroxy-6-metoxy-1,4-benzoquinol methylase
MPTTEVQEAAAEVALQGAYQQFTSKMEELQTIARNIVDRFPRDSEASLFLADTLLAAGRADLALSEYKKAQELITPNQKRRVDQAIRQCMEDRDYFPATFAERLQIREYAIEKYAESWGSYAWREIQRGREIARLMRQRIPLRGRRVLDVGTCYGGALIAFAEQGADAVGVEIDKERVAVGQQRLQDLGISADLREDDICAPGIIERLGTFDVIVAQDVIEHVFDPEETIRALAQLLRPSGVLYFQVGNKYSPDQLLADHHYRLPGITMLSREQAIEYFRLATGFGAQDYGVGYWRTELYYRKKFARFGVRVEHLDHFPNVDYVTWYSRQISQVLERVKQEIYPGLRPELQKRIRDRMTAMGRYFLRISQIILQRESNAQLTSVLSDRLICKLCVPVWRLIGTKATQ